MLRRSSVTITDGDAAYKTLPNNTNSSWFRDKGLRRLNLNLVLLFLSAAGNGFDGGLINGLLAISYFMSNIGENISDNMEGLLIAGIALGTSFSLVPASYFADRFGRRPCVAVGSSLMLVGPIIQTFTSGPWAFFGTRVVIGIGVAFAQCSAPPLTSELAHPRHRGLVSAAFQSTWYWGSILAAVTTLGTLYIDNSWSWRLPCLLQVFFPALQLIGTAIAPESPRFLISKGRDEEALLILAKYHANGDLSDALVQFEYNEIRQAIQQETNYDNGWSAFLKTKGNLHRLAICVSCGVMIEWAGNGVVSYYLTPVLESLGIVKAVDQEAINLGMQVWNAICAMAGSWLAESHGRRPLWMISTVLQLIFFCAVTALSAVFAEKNISGAGTATVVFLFLFFGAYDIAYTPLSIAYPVEILPFYLRAKGMSINLTVVYTTNFFNQFVNPIGLGAIGWKYYFVFIGCLIVWIFIVYFLFPETQGRTLEEVAIVFDGQDAATEIARKLDIDAIPAEPDFQEEILVTKQ